MGRPRDRAPIDQEELEDEQYSRLLRCFLHDKCTLDGRSWTELGVLQRGFEAYARQVYNIDAEQIIPVFPKHHLMHLLIHLSRMELPMCSSCCLSEVEVRVRLKDMPESYYEEEDDWTPMPESTEEDSTEGDSMDD